MQQPSRSTRRDWILIAAVVLIVSAGWVAALLLWPRKAPTPPPPAVVEAPPVQATRSAPASRPAIQAVDLLAPRSQPATQPVSRDALLLEALQRAEQLKAEGKPQEALAELQRALQSGSPASSQPGQDAQANISSLLSQLSQSSQPADQDALLAAALQSFVGSASELAGFLDELEQDTGGKPRTKKPRQQVSGAQPGSADASAQPVGPSPSDAVAYVYGQPITRGQIGAGPAGPTQASVARLNEQILQSLLEIYCKSAGITASLAEINEYRLGTGAKPIAPPRPARPSPGNRPPPRPEPGTLDPAAETAIIRWKVSQSLYEQYGGTVIAGPSNRLEPVGAYRQFLREMQSKAAFRIEDPQFEKRLWDYYDQDFGPKAVPSEKVDFKKPWWTRPAAPSRQ